jgi:hypothetical protein
VKKKSDYLRHAEECRTLARQMEQGEHRDQLLKMAETWAVLAEERDRTLHYARPEADPPLTTESSVPADVRPDLDSPAS